MMVRCLLVGMANAEQGMLVQGADAQVPAHRQARLGEACRDGDGGSAGHAERSRPAAAGHDRGTGVLTALDGRLRNDWTRRALAGRPDEDVVFVEDVEHSLAHQCPRPGSQRLQAGGG